MYNCYKDCVIEGRILYLTEAMNCALVTSTYTVDVDAHTMFSNITNEVVGTGYTANGATLGTKTSTQDNTNNRGVMDAADVTWTTSTMTARAAIIMQWTGTASTSELVCYIDFGADKSSSSSDFTISWHADGILYLG